MPRRGGKKQTRQRAGLGAAFGVQYQVHLSPPYSLKDEPTWVIEEIINSGRKHGKTFYKVKWKPTREPAESLQGTADEAIAEFHLMNAG
ncbi:hypothetical protein CKM354_000783900 [Cercospora kikuchii]|uniref:Chromo domain-containing protein n=1 Tax=Cercospora kikuchii TaxID=84275 RepID=A0A9P3CKX6_9PEZI|nr:uncharacterized protein CKM354_000783900 [Cercospora kikuchii]GIZ44648.1 hypothetical protein CKM354_000783900 [Cercospora kikuchii]